ncbi:MAG: 1-acyl-sn-glycerol-3-phosphate acyltransferase [Flavobacteriales bacterium]|jgi:1-acyl-sn-glycerol-3-phosphate acyltransferase|nr:1-acyl-sn-glycerol-3-phosphate acyltransferase [Flavobacteriales bacterium]
MYVALRASVRAALHLYCGRIRVDVRSAPAANAVLILASNHPNSFFDALVIATHLPHRMRFLARGDAFRNPRAAKILRALFMIPIYRMSEGRGELKRTGDSFLQAQEDLEQGGSVLLFAEGNSANEPGLRPLGKGTARIAYRAWQSDLDVQVLPLWLRYDTFHRPFMEVGLSSGNVMEKSDVDAAPEAMFLRQFNTELRERLLITSAKSDADRTYDLAQRSRLARAIRRSLLALPALAGLLLHSPWYFSLRAFTAGKTRGTVFFDSVLFGLLFLTYPLWLACLVCLAAWAGLGSWSLALIAMAPLCLAALRGFSMR